MEKVVRRDYGTRVSLKSLKDILSSLLDGRAKEVPAIFVWGPPGIGKSSVVREVAEEKGLSLIDLRLSLLDPVDLRGVPFVEKGGCRWSRPPFIPSEGKGVLFLDELNLASPAVQSSAFQLILDRRVGEHHVGEDWFIISAGNRRDESSVVFDLPKPLLNRFTHFEVEINVDDWLEWAIKNDIDERIIAFIKFRPELLLKMDGFETTVFPTPRSWEFCSRFLKKGLSIEVAAQASVGTGAAAEFSAFCQIFSEIPDVEALLGRGEIPDLDSLKPSTLIAFCTSVVVRAKKNHIDNVLKLVEKLGNGRREIGVYVWKHIYKRYKEETLNSPLWKECLRKYRDVFCE